MFSLNAISSDSFLYILFVIFLFAVLYYVCHAIFFTFFNLAFGIKERNKRSFLPDLAPSILTLMMWMVSFLMVKAIPYNGLFPAFFSDFNSILTILTATGAFFLIDFIEYWMHFMLHKIPFLWRFHKIHHDPTHLNWSKAIRLSSIESFSTSFLVNLILLLFFGKEKLLFLAVLFGFKRFYGFFLHSNTDIAYGNSLRLFASPRFHHWHHGADIQNPQNLSTLFPFWDKLFGTYYGEGTEMPSAYGLISHESKINIMPTIMQK